jgi:type IV pilus modification protein PilV
MSKLQRNQAGFSLIELLISILILAIGIIGIMALFPQSYNYVGSAGRLSAMNHLAQQKLDELRRLGYTNADLVAGIHPTIPLRITNVDPLGAAVYTITWTVVDNQPQTDMKTVNVEVAHQLYDNSNNKINPSKAINQKVINFETYFAK